MASTCLRQAFSRGGGLFTSVKMNTIFLESFPNAWSSVRSSGACEAGSVVVDILFCTQLLVIFVQEIVQLGKAVGRREAWPGWRGVTALWQARKHVRKGWTILQALTISGSAIESHRKVPRVGGVLVVLGYCWEFALRDEVRLEFQAVTAQQLQAPVAF